MLALILKKDGIAGGEIASLLGFQSSNFKFVYKDGVFTFTACGCGHLVGMSQYGANALAAQGKTYDEIISFYFKGVETITLK